MIRFFAFFLLTVCSLSALGQGHMEDVVYLKNGAVLRGMIVEQIPGESITIRTESGKAFTYRMDEIEKIRKEIEPEHQKQITEKWDGRIKQSGFIIIPEITFGRGINKTVAVTEESNEQQETFNQISSGPSVGLSSVFGFQPSPYFSGGFGMGFFIHEQFRLVPLFLDARGFLLNRKLSPYICASYGVSLMDNEILQRPLVADNYTGGEYYNFGLGARLFITERTALNLTFSIRHQNVEAKVSSYSYYSASTNSFIYVDSRTENLKLNFMCMRFGLSF